MRHHKASRLAILAMAELAQDPLRAFSAAEIAARYGQSINHLAKILTQLAQAGLAESVRGAQGGYRLNMDSLKRPLSHITTIFEPEDDVIAPVSAKAHQNSNTLASLENKARRVFKETTLEAYVRLTR